LLAQMKIGGRLVIPVGEGDTQVMLEIVRVSEQDYTRQEHGNFKFVPMLADRAR
jgi:protein-L-isoaspartate(D-aspartate) O-methyltransferase